MFSLLRRMALLGIVLAMSGGIASAKNLNYHDGIVLFVNDSAYPLDVAVRRDYRRIDGPIPIPPHKAYAFNTCCYAAVVGYDLQVSTTTHDAGGYGRRQSWTHYFKPVPCNHGGTTFGYSIVRFSVLARDETTGRLQGAFQNGPRPGDELRCGQQLLDDLRNAPLGNL